MVGGSGRAKKDIYTEGGKSKGKYRKTGKESREREKKENHGRDKMAGGSKGKKAAKTQTKNGRTRCRKRVRKEHVNGRGVNLRMREDGSKTFENVRKSKELRENASKKIGGRRRSTK